MSTGESHVTDTGPHVTLRSAPCHVDAPRGRTDVLVAWQGRNYSSRLNFPMHETTPAIEAAAFLRRQQRSVA